MNQGNGEPRAPIRWRGAPGVERLQAAWDQFAVDGVHIVHDRREGAGGVPGQPGHRLSQFGVAAATEAVRAGDLGEEVRGGGWVSQTHVHDLLPFCSDEGHRAVDGVGAPRRPAWFRMELADYLRLPYKDAKGTLTR